MGVIDNNYCGDNDEWTMVFYATQNSVMRIGDRPGQMQLFYDVCIHQFEEVEHLGNEDRGGYGSTGK